MAIERITLIIDYGKILSKMIEDGKYGDVAYGFTDKNFPFPEEIIGKKVSVSAELSRLTEPDGAISQEKSLIKITEAGHKPANLFELLALGAEFPDLQRKFYILALGSPIRKFVPCLSQYGVTRKLNLIWFGGELNDHCRFLVIH